MKNSRTNALVTSILLLTSISMAGSISLIKKANHYPPAVAETVEKPTEKNDTNADNLMPIYYFEEEGYVEEYPFEIQNEIWNQYREFKGDLPPYEMVLSLWISESVLRPDAVSFNDAGTYNVGIPQLNTLTLQDCKTEGWYDPDQDDIQDYRTQIRLGLLVLNNLCESAPGGEWEYYRAIRAYQIGLSGLEKRESEGDFGANDSWKEGKSGTWYPGRYGIVKHIEAHLVEEAVLYVAD